jgi:hypothetical protein
LRGHDEAPGRTMGAIGMADEPERSVHEGEIIPPGRAGPRARRPEPDVRLFINLGEAARFRVVRPGPVGSFLIGLLIAVVVVTILVLLVGAFLLWIPLMALFIAGAVIVGLLRAYFQRRT